ncbi:MAG: hypothetical protein WC620_06735 [Methanoregula sp.]
MPAIVSSPPSVDLPELKPRFLPTGQPGRPRHNRSTVALPRESDILS